ncbi:MAG: hypothetical protein MZV70_13045 [Desulfobacterales bacterium]|nr:hypothetical protein [Desulfobacterales bacterium]
MDKFAGTGLTPLPCPQGRMPDRTWNARSTLNAAYAKAWNWAHTPCSWPRWWRFRSALTWWTPRGRLDLQRAGLLAFAHGHYFALGRHLGHFGFSVRRRKKRAGA